MLKYLVIILSIFSVNSARVIENKPLDYEDTPQIGSIEPLNESQIIGSNPKTWSPVPSDTALDCATCKILVATIETDACLKCSESDKCTQLVTAFGDPEKICQFIDICPKTSWLKKVFG